MRLAGKSRFTSRLKDEDSRSFMKAAQNSPVTRRSGLLNPLGANTQNSDSGAAVRIGKPIKLLRPLGQRTGYAIGSLASVPPGDAIPSPCRPPNLDAFASLRR